MQHWCAGQRPIGPKKANVIQWRQVVTFHRRQPLHQLNGAPRLE
ncbi:MULTISPECIES: hypothetical protein [unclassified Pseudomonas]